MTTSQPPSSPPPPPVQVVIVPGRSNGPATASMVLGIIGFVLMGVPFFIGWIIGGVPDLIAIVLGIVGLNNEAARRGIGKGMAIVGIVLGGVSILSVFLGAGWLW